MSNLIDKHIYYFEVADNAMIDGSIVKIWASSEEEAKFLYNKVMKYPDSLFISDFAEIN